MTTGLPRYSSTLATEPERTSAPSRYVTRWPGAGSFASGPQRSEATATSAPRPLAMPITKFVLPGRFQRLGHESLASLT